jgi:hypothetical protein
LTHDLQIGVSFEELSEFESGGTTILSYNLQIDLAGGGNGPWTNVQGYTSDSLDLQGTVVIPNSQGNYYYFRYRAKNAHGWGEFSPIMWVLLANRPDTILDVQTTNVGLNVEISWAETPHNRYSNVIDYRIKIMRSDGIYIEHASCDGQDPTIITDRICSVTMLSLLDV